MYNIISNIRGPTSWYGEEGQETVECQGVHCIFSYSGASRNETDASRGQFPALLLSCSCFILSKIVEAQKF